MRNQTSAAKGETFAAAPLIILVLDDFRLNSLVVKMTNAILLKRREELRISKVGFEYYVIDSGVVQLMREPRAEGQTHQFQSIPAQWRFFFLSCSSKEVGMRCETIACPQTRKEIDCLYSSLKLLHFAALSNRTRPLFFF